MPEYTANGILSHGGRAVRPGERIKLTEDQAAALGKKVTPTQVTDPNMPISEMGVKQLRSLAKISSIENYSKMDKAELQKQLGALSNQPASEPEQVEVIPDEPARD